MTRKSKKSRERKSYIDAVSDTYDRITKGVQTMVELERRHVSDRFVGLIQDYVNTEESPEVRKVLKELLREAKR